MKHKKIADQVFDKCVDLLNCGAKKLDISYKEINVVIFCIAWPVVTAGLVYLAFKK